MASRGRFRGRGSWLQFHNKSASISPPNILHFSRDRATIGPRLGHDRATIGPRSWSWSFVDRLLLDWRRFHHANSPIAVRSSRDLRVFPEPLDAVRSIIRRLEGHDRAIAIHSPRPFDGDPTVLMRRAATCLKKIILTVNCRWSRRHIRLQRISSRHVEWLKPRAFNARGFI